jgi:hypothetical protein
MQLTVEIEGEGRNAFSNKDQRGEELQSLCEFFYKINTIQIFRGPRAADSASALNLTFRRLQKRQ